MVVLVCHRGASALAPENTLAAFRLAMESGIDFSELDVHVSRDGDLVVTHDPVEDPVAEHALPRLQDVFDLVRGRMGIYVELKGERTGAALGELLAHGAGDGVALICGSAELDLVAELRAAAPDVPRSILFTQDWSGRTQEMIDACRQLAVAYAHPCFRPIEAAAIDAFHAAGLLVMTPHTNDPDEAQYFFRIGVNVVASDDPRVLLPLRGC
ncbi:MAG TPA: glycerophosphodiester phosphodiesterase [Chloroflexota bacterium]|nr:glycerophosphodiester phosphodiesterase [Chloroflexota bacterium]